MIRRAGRTLIREVITVELPLGFGMALAQNAQAMEYFSALPQQRQEDIVQQTHAIQSKQEMQDYVQGLINKY
jgi:hypothetical protein